MLLRLAEHFSFQESFMTPLFTLNCLPCRF